MMLKEQAANISTAFASKLDDEMIHAARSVAGYDLDLEELAKRCKILHFPDGSEVFEVDGKIALEIGPMVIERSADGVSTKIRVSRSVVSHVE